MFVGHEDARNAVLRRRPGRPAAPGRDKQPLRLARVGDDAGRAFGLQEVVQVGLNRRRSRLRVAVDLLRLSPSAVSFLGSCLGGCSRKDRTHRCSWTRPSAGLGAVFGSSFGRRSAEVGGR